MVFIFSSKVEDVQDDHVVGSIDWFAMQHTFAPKALVVKSPGGYVSSWNFYVLARGNIPKYITFFQVSEVLINYI